MKAALRASFAAFRSGCNRPIASRTYAVAGCSTRHTWSKKPE